MNILILCRRGRVRSKALAAELEKRGHDIRYKAGEINNNHATKEDIDWADKILLMEDWMVYMFPSLDKVILMGNIPDIYFDCEQPELKRLCKGIVPFLERFEI